MTHSCAVCPVEHYARGFCRPHYRRWRKWGDPLYDALALENRLNRKIDRSDDCWIWLGARNDKGYPQIQVDGKRQYAHRVMYERHVGRIPDGYEVDHLCSTPLCVNPAHLEAVTPSANAQRSWDRGERQRPTHCKWGHEFTPENTYIQTRGGRGCRECSKISNRLRYRRLHGIPLDAPLMKNQYG